MQDDPCMLGLVEILVGRTLGSLRELGRGLGRQKLLNYDRGTLVSPYKASNSSDMLLCTGCNYHHIVALMITDQRVDSFAQG